VGPGAGGSNGDMVGPRDPLEQELDQDQAHCGSVADADAGVGTVGGEGGWSEEAETRLLRAMGWSGSGGGGGGVAASSVRNEQGGGGVKADDD